MKSIQHFCINAVVAHSLVAARALDVAFLFENGHVAPRAVELHVLQQVLADQVWVAAVVALEVLSERSEEVLHLNSVFVEHLLRLFDQEFPIRLKQIFSSVELDMTTMLLKLISSKRIVIR